MANQWNSPIATQTVVWRGTSTVETLDISNAFPAARALNQAIYGLNITGGVSGNFSVAVVGHVGGYTYHLAGLTNISAAGSYILYPAVYGPTGGISGTFAVGANLGDAQRLDWTVPPARVHFIANTGTAGISASCTVSACLSVNR